MQDYAQDEYFQGGLYKCCQDAYSLCLLGLFCSYLTIVTAVIVAAANLEKAKNTRFYSHLQFVLLGTVYYTAVLAGCVAVCVWIYRQHYFSQGVFWTPLFAYLFFGLFPFVWWPWRFAKGFKLLKAGQPVQNPFSPWMPR